MKNQRFISTNIDFLGFSASMLCAIHCAVTPLLLTMGSLGSLAFLENPLIEVVVLLTGCCLALISLLPGYLKKHRNPRPISLMLAGSSIIMTGHLMGSVLSEGLLVPSGAIIIAMAHYNNWHLNKKTLLKTAYPPKKNQSRRKKYTASRKNILTHIEAV